MMFDLSQVNHLRQVDPRLAKVIEHIGNINYNSYTNHRDSFMFLVREIVGQMISSSVKKVIWGRF